MTNKLTTAQVCSVTKSAFRNFRYLFTLTLICFSWLAKGQSSAGVNLSKTFPSPDVAALGTFGLIPANPFNGQANVSIPLYTVSYKDLEVPITLSFATGGLKPDDHPGWTGLGWSLKSGGMIYRKVNGIYDEFPSNSLIGSHQSYYDHCGRVTANFSNLDTVKAYAFDGSNLPIAYGFDGMPDEFIFNFNGYSGVFYITRPSQNEPIEIKVRSNGAYRLKAEIVEIKPNITFNDYWNTEGQEFSTRLTDRSIFKLKVTDDKGIQYIFGGDPNAIEFSNNGNFAGQHYHTIASAWHLTEIVSPAGYKIQFTYKKKGRVIAQHQQRNVTFYDLNYNFGHNFLVLFRNTNGEYSFSGGMDVTSFMIQNPAWLEKIITPLQTITFTSSRSNELDYSLSPIKVTEVFSPMERFGAHISYWQKLDEINIPGVKTIHFNYRHQTDKRLRLDSLVFVAPNQHKINGYGFRYNDLQLPSYNSRQTDHWGYFNNRSYAYGNDYLTLREPVAQYLQAEMLKQINYPTGGYLKLEYEPHSYRKLCKQFPFSVETQSADLMAGGLRVKKMISTANANDTPLVKEYFYSTDYINQGAASSGILSGTPQYTNTGSSRGSYRTGNFWAGTWGSHNLYYGRIVDNNFLQLSSTNGNHVTYSEVTEKSGDGYIVHKYSNHDNGYADKAPYIMHTNFTSQIQEEGFISLAPFRGLPVNTTYFDEARRRLKSVSYNYLIDTSLVYKVRQFYRINDNVGGVPLTRVSTCAYFTKPALLRSQTETDYIAGATDSLFVNKTYRYFPDIYSVDPSDDNFQPADVSRTTSKNETVKTVFRYPFDMVQLSADPTGVYREMTGMNIVSPVIEAIKSKGTTQIELVRNNYFKPATGIYALDSVQVKLFNEPIETRFHVHKYDNRGNIIEQSKPNDVNEVILWGYKGQYPVAKIRGSSYTTAVQYVSLSLLDNAENTTDSRLRTELNKLRTNLPNAFVTTYTWIPFVGMATETDAQGRTAFYEYDAAGRLKLVKNHDGHIMKKFCYNYAGQPSACEGLVFTSIARSEPFTRNNCTGCLVPGTVNYTVAAKKYYSELNQEDADAQATAEINANGQNYANQHGTCTKPYIFVKMGFENVVSNQMNITADVVFKFYGDSLFSVPVSVTDLNVNYRSIWNHCGATPHMEESDHVIRCTGTEKRFNAELFRDIGDGIHCFSTDFMLLGSDCYYHTVFANAQLSQSFNRNNCTAPFTGTAVTYTVPYGRYRSIVSQAVVEAQALADMNANGQNHANANGSCVMYNVERSQQFTRNNCAAPQYGGKVTYTVPAGKHSSTISQEDANAKAQNDINTNGQNYANINGACIMPGFPFVKMELTNYTYNGMSTSADMVFRFYSNPEKTVPMSVTNLDVRYLATTYMCDGQTSSGPITIRCNGTSVTKRVDINHDIGDGLHCYAMEYELLAGSNYYK